MLNLAIPSWDLDRGTLRKTNMAPEGRSFKEYSNRQGALCRFYVVCLESRLRALQGLIARPGMEPPRSDRVFPESPIWFNQGICRPP